MKEGYIAIENDISFWRNSVFTDIRLNTDILMIRRFCIFKMQNVKRRKKAGIKNGYIFFMDKSICS